MLALALVVVDAFFVAGAFLVVVLVSVFLVAAFFVVVALVAVAAFGLASLAGSFVSFY